ncbi:hypothetical protein ACIBRY_20450 [Streptomyces anulatus]
MEIGTLAAQERPQDVCCPQFDCLSSGHVEHVTTIGHRPVTEVDEEPAVSHQQGGDPGHRQSAFLGVQVHPHSSGEDRIEPAAAWVLVKNKGGESVVNPLDRAARMDSL